MGRFLIFVGVVLLLTIIGIFVWWLANSVYISIQRDNKKFEIEEEGYEFAKECIRDHYEDDFDDEFDNNRKWF